MSSIGAASTLSRASAHSMGFSSSSGATSIFSSQSHADIDGFFESPYRAGGPRLTSLPAARVSVGSEYARGTIIHDQNFFNTLDRTVRHILRDLNITDQVLFLDTYGRISLVRPESRPIPTILVVFRESSGTQSSRWRTAAKRIHARFQSDLRDLSVELIDERLLKRPRCYPLPDSHPIISKWDTLCQTIFAACDTRSWVGLSCWRWGVEDDPEQNPVTVIVSLKESARGSFTSVARHIRSLLSVARISDVDVILLRNEIRWGVTGNGFDRYGLEPEACRKTVQPGVSIGIHGFKSGSSTLGGLVDLKFADSSIWLTFALTCFHCTWPPLGTRGRLEDNTRVKEALDSFEFEPVLPDDPRARQLLRIDQPAESDLRDSIKIQEEREESVRIDDFIKIQNQLMKGDFVLPHNLRWYEVQRDTIKGYQRVKKFFADALANGTLLGHVFAGSGVNRVQRRRNGDIQILDWALIEVLPARMPRRKELADWNQPFKYSSESTGTWRSVCTGDLLSEDKVQKSGRTAGITYGEVTKVRPSQIVEDPTGDRSRPTRRRLVTHEWEIIGKHQEPFAIPGDSGSFVGNGRGEVVGMLLGGHERTDTSIFTPMVEIFDDIKRITNAVEVRIALGKED